MSRRRDLPSSDGFALIEALVSLALVALTSLLIVAGVGTGRRVWETMDATAAGGEAVDGAQFAIRSRLERLFPASRFIDQTPVGVFQGEAGSLEFLAPATSARGPDAMQSFRLALTDAGELVLESRSELAVAGAQASVERRRLLSGVRSLDISYFGASAEQPVPLWRPQWRNEAFPPRLIRIRVSFPPKDNRSWPDLLVQPDASVDDLCVLYVGRGRCLGRS